jgi:fluoride exporter
VSLALVLGIGLIGGAGAIARFLLDGVVGARAGRAFPFGTLIVNLSGAFILGAFVGATLTSDGYRLAGTGFIGAYTTFSTWMLESHRLAEDGELMLGGLNFGISLVLGVLVAWLGRHVGAAL